ncbi:MAG: excinuclease ABC subunit UvrC [Oscillospiraceae bacterium]|jgi:excinuclease ABC subunit C|nr:excinuclease ABC subunit UvrC [Oscillospiraceae bacterium]
MSEKEIDIQRLRRLKNKANALPLTPGVYLMKDARGQILYVGKAKALKNRVGSYFTSQQHNLMTKVRAMVANVEDFDVILTDTEQECLLLECSLIKQHAPKYNILLKDDKGFHYLRVTPPPWSNFYEAKQIADDGAQYLGPYTSAWLVNQAVDAVKKIFRLPQCAKVFPRDIGKSRPCLNFFIGLCSAPCAGKIKQEAYVQCVADALSFLKQGESKAMEELQNRMEKAAEALDFENAARLRDSIKAMEQLSRRQKVVNSSYKEQDVFAVVREREKSCLCVLRFADGKLTDAEHFIIDTPCGEELPEVSRGAKIGSLPEARRELLLRYYTMREFIPRRIVLDGETADISLLAAWLSEKAGRKISIALPEKGEALRLVEMCRANAAQYLAQHMGRQGKTTAALDELAGVLGLPTPPTRIEAYDISHTGGAQNVAGMIVFEDGVPLKRAYKRFQIRTVDGADDYASMAEVLRRRLKHYVDEKDKNDGFGCLPDLILLDGGQGQIHAAQPILKEFALPVPLFGMVKDSRHRTRAIALDGGEISLTVKRAAFALVGRIQEEVHRFAIAYHRQKRGKATMSGTLTQIDGIGEGRAKALLKHFKTMQKIRAATVEELAAVPGMTEPAVRAVYNYFNNKTGT